MAVKFAAYETMRAVHRKMAGDRPAHTLEDLVMGGVAGELFADYLGFIELLNLGFLLVSSCCKL